MLLAAERYKSSDPVNVGSGEEISIADLAGGIATLARFSGRIVLDTSRPNGQTLGGGSTHRRWKHGSAFEPRRR